MLKRLQSLFLFIIALTTTFGVLIILNQKNQTDNTAAVKQAENNSPTTEAVMTEVALKAHDSRLSESENRTITMYEKASPAVVFITTYKTEYVHYFFDVYPQTSEGQGSGVIIDSHKGYIITNYHVVGNADRLSVTLNETQEEFDAKIVGVDPENDLAVIRLSKIPKNLVSIPLGRSSNLKIGQNVYAIGNPFGFDRTLTSGIVSALNRNLKTKSGSVIEGAIQTDASINPGNSGGPLLDSSGNLIGINTMIVSPSSGSVGIGFAIPVDSVKRVVTQLIEYGYVKRGWIDATFIPLNPRLARALRINSSTGLLVQQVATGGEAFKAGLLGGTQRAVYGNNIIYIGGEVITSIDGVAITDYNSLVNVLKNSKVGQVVKVSYIKDFKEKTTNVKLIDKRMFTEQ